MEFAPVYVFYENPYFQWVWQFKHHTKTVYLPEDFL